MNKMEWDKMRFLEKQKPEPRDSLSTHASFIPLTMKTELSELTFLEAESALLFPHSVQTGLAETKFTEARNKRNKKATRLLTRTDC